MATIPVVAAGCCVTCSTVSRIAMRLLLTSGISIDLVAEARLG